MARSGSFSHHELREAVYQCPDRIFQVPGTIDAGTVFRYAARVNWAVGVSDASDSLLN